MFLISTYRLTARSAAARASISFSTISLSQHLARLDGTLASVMAWIGRLGVTKSLWALDHHVPAVPAWVPNPPDAGTLPMVPEVGLTDVYEDVYLVPCAPTCALPGT